MLMPPLPSRRAQCIAVKVSVEARSCPSTCRKHDERGFVLALVRADDPLRLPVFAQELAHSLARQNRRPKGFDLVREKLQASAL